MPQRFWSVELSAKGGPFKLKPKATLQIANVAFAHDIVEGGKETADDTSRTTLRVHIFGEDFKSPQIACIATLHARKNHRLEHAQCDIFLNRGEEYCLDVVGPNVLSVSGRYFHDPGASEDDKQLDDGEHSHTGEVLDGTVGARKGSSKKGEKSKAVDDPAAAQPKRVRRNASVSKAPKPPAAS